MVDLLYTLCSLQTRYADLDAQQERVSEKMSEVSDAIDKLTDAEADINDVENDLDDLLEDVLQHENSQLGCDKLREDTACASHPSWVDRPETLKAGYHARSKLMCKCCGKTMNSKKYDVHNECLFVHAFSHDAGFHREECMEYKSKRQRFNNLNLYVRIADILMELSKGKVCCSSGYGETAELIGDSKYLGARKRAAHVSFPYLLRDY